MARYLTRLFSGRSHGITDPGESTRSTTVMLMATRIPPLCCRWPRGGAAEARSASHAGQLDLSLGRSCMRAPEREASTPGASLQVIGQSPEAGVGEGRSALRQVALNGGHRRLGGLVNGISEGI